MEVRMVASFGFGGLFTKVEASELLVIFYELTWVAVYKLYKNASNNVKICIPFACIVHFIKKFIR